MYSLQLRYLEEEIIYWRNMSADNGEKTDSSTNVVRIEENNSSADMASVLQALQSSLTQLAEVSKAQTEAFNNLRDLLLQPDEEDEEVDLDTTSNSLDITAATNRLLDSSNGQSPKSAPSTSRSDSEPKKRPSRQPDSGLIVN